MAVLNNFKTSTSFEDIASYQGIAGEYTELYSSTMESPAPFFYFSFLTILGSLYSRLVELNLQISTQPRLYTVLIGPSSTARKSTAIKETMKFFDEGFPGAVHSIWGVNSDIGLQDEINEDHRPLVLCYDELQNFLVKCRISGSSLLQTTTTLYDSNRIDSRKSNVKIHIPDGHLCIISACTDQTFENIWDTESISIGFPNRLWLVYGNSDKKEALPDPIPEHRKQIIWDKLDQLKNFIGGGMKINITNNAKVLYTEWYDALPRTLHTKRIETYAMKLMVLDALSRISSSVDKDDVKRILNICDWQINIRSIHDPIDAENKIARMEEKIRRYLNSSHLPINDLKRKVHYSRDGLWVFNQSLENLVSSKEVVYNAMTGVYRLNR